MDCSRSSRQTSASSRGAFKRLGADAAKMAVAAGSVVERFDVVEDIGARQIPSLVDALLDAFLLQAAEEGLGRASSISSTVIRAVRLGLALNCEGTAGSSQRSCVAVPATPTARRT